MTFNMRKKIASKKAFNKKSKSEVSAIASAFLIDMEKYKDIEDADSQVELSKHMADHMLSQKKNSKIFIDVSALKEKYEDNKDYPYEWSELIPNPCVASFDGVKTASCNRTFWLDETKVIDGKSYFVYKED